MFYYHYNAHARPPNTHQRAHSLSISLNSNSSVTWDLDAIRSCSSQEIALITSLRLALVHQLPTHYLSKSWIDGWSSISIEFMDAKICKMYMNLHNYERTLNDILRLWVETCKMNSTNAFPRIGCAILWLPSVACFVSQTIFNIHNGSHARMLSSSAHSDAPLPEIFVSLTTIRRFDGSARYCQQRISDGVSSFADHHSGRCPTDRLVCCFFFYTQHTARSLKLDSRWTIT